MKLELNVEQDQELRAYIKDLIAGQVRSVIREEFREMVSEAIMDIVQSQTANISAQKLIDRQVRKMVTTALASQASSASGYIRQLAGAEIKNIIRETIGDRKIADLI